MFKASPFLVGDDCVSIMNGTDEGSVARAFCARRLSCEVAVLRATGSSQLAPGQMHGWTGLSDHPIPNRSLTISVGLLGASMRFSS